MDNFITPELLKKLGFIITKQEEIKDNVIYAEAVDQTGMTELSWNTRGRHCTYFGEDLEPNISFVIKKDGGTRTAFNGYIFNPEQVELLLKLTW